MALGDFGNAGVEDDYESDLSFLLQAGSFVEHMAKEFPNKTIAVRMSLQDCGEMVKILKEWKKNETCRP